jgi:anthranilate synthase component 1
MNKDSFKQHIVDGYNHIPVYRILDIDTNTDTALNLYLKLANTAYSYLFESVEGGKKWVS